MRLRSIALILTVLAATLIISIIMYFKLPRRLKGDRFVASWRELQGYCKDKATWPLAIIEADKLFDAALKKRKLKGKTMGARMVAAQRILTGNDDVWFAHNLAKKLKVQSDIVLKEADVKSALMGFRQALKDIS